MINNNSNNSNGNNKNKNTNKNKKEIVMKNSCIQPPPSLQAAKKCGRMQREGWVWNCQDDPGEEQSEPIGTRAAQTFIEHKQRQTQPAHRAS